MLLKFRSTAVSTVLSALIVAACARQLDACSVAMCVGRGIELEPAFAVTVKVGRSGIQGATVEVKDSKTDRVLMAELTDKTGRVPVKRLAPGDYWINVTYLGISAASHCFHVRSRSSIAAKTRLRYRWGDYAMALRSVSGILKERQPGRGGTPIWNLTHGVTTSIRGATAVLENAFTRDVLRSQSDENGQFQFPAVTDGLYVLHIEGGATTRPYTPTDMIISVDHTATRNSIPFVLQEDGCGLFMLSPQWHGV